MQERLPAAMGRLAAKFVPGAGLASMLYQGLTFLANNLPDLGTVVTGFVNALDHLIVPDHEAFKNALLTTFRNAVPVLMSFAASQLGMGGLPGQIRSVVSYVPSKVSQALQAVVGRVATTLGGGTSAGMFTGKLAPERVF